MPFYKFKQTHRVEAMKQLTNKTSIAVILSCISMVFSSFSANAFEAGDVIIRAGVAYVSPDESSTNLSINDVAVQNTGVGVESNTQLGAIGTYMVTDHWGVSVLASTPFKHNIKGENIGISDVGSAKHLPPTVTLDYFPLKASSPLQIHAGLGLNYTIFYTEDLSSEFNNAFSGENRLDLTNSLGLALKAGLDYQINDKFGINATVYRIDLDSDATISTATARIDVDVDIDPYVYIVGLSYKF